MSLIEAHETVAPEAEVRSSQNLPLELSSLAIFGASQFENNAAVHNGIGSGIAVPTPEELDAALGVSALEFLAERQRKGAQDQLFVSPIVGESTVSIVALAEACVRRGKRIQDRMHLLGQFNTAYHNNHAPEHAYARAWVLLRDGAHDNPSFVGDSANVQRLRLNGEETSGVRLTTPTLADVLMADLVRMEADQPLLGEQAEYAFRLSSYVSVGNYYLPETEVDGPRRVISLAFPAEMGHAGIYRSVDVALL